MINDLQQLHDEKNKNFVARLHLELSAMRGGLRDSSKTKQADAGASFTPTDAPGVVRPSGDIGNGEK